MPSAKTLPFKPTSSRLLVQPVPPETETKAGLIIPESAQAPQAIGIVRAIGPDVKVISVGDTVVYGRYAGTAVELKDVEYIVMKEDDVLLTI